MKLQKVRIKNFRSIEEVEIYFDSSLKVLVGKNESGKSNIIKALFLLKNDVKSQKEDIRESLPNEEAVSSSFVTFYLKLEPEENEQLYLNVLNHFDAGLDTENDFIILKEGKISLKEFCSISVPELHYSVNIDYSINYYSKPSINFKNYKITKSIVKPKNIKIDDKTLPSLNPFFIDELFYENNYDLLTVEDIDTIIKVELINLAKANALDVLYWSYDEANLLPSRINIEEFSNDPDSCKPLKNIFHLAGHNNISIDIKEARKFSPNKYRNFLNRIAQHATEHFRKTWEEYRDVSFSLEPNGDYIETGIKEHNTYSFQQRSDGFKRFIGFLLMISISVKTKTLKNNLILVDEPDVSLHPSGVRYLRDELKKISEHNIVVAATHSIFMINSDYLEDYFIVKKHEEKTIIEKPSEANIASEEVLYRALNFSIYELLKNENILFEGWRDKKLYNVALSKLPFDYKQLKTVFNNVGVSHTSGVKNVKNITPIFELVNKNCIIISDCDKAAREKQKEFRKEKYYGDWYRYDEIDKESIAITGEDYLNDSAINKAVKKLIQMNPDLNGIPDFTQKKGVIANFGLWLTGQRATLSKELNEYEDEFKNNIFSELKPADIAPSYYLFLLKLSHKITNQTGASL